MLALLAAMRVEGPLPLHCPAARRRPARGGRETVGRRRRRARGPTRGSVAAGSSDGRQQAKRSFVRPHALQRLVSTVVAPAQARTCHTNGTPEAAQHAACVQQAAPQTGEATPSLHAQVQVKSARASASAIASASASASGTHMAYIRHGLRAYVSTHCDTLCSCERRGGRRCCPCTRTDSGRSGSFGPPPAAKPRRDRRRLAIRVRALRSRCAARARW